VPDWPVVAALVVAGLGPETPAAVTGGPGGRIVAVSAPARSAGVRRGMRRREAQGRCPDLQLWTADDARDAREFEPVAVAAETVVSGLEIARPGLLLLPSGGAARYHGSERDLARELTEQVAVRTGHECQVGVADGFLAAVLAAREDAVVPPGASRDYLASRPAAVLVHARPADRALTELVDLWRRLGVRTLAELAALPDAAVAARFGDLGVWAQRLARGQDVRPPARRRLEEDLTVAEELDPPAHQVDVATFAARRLAERLHEDLSRRGLACGRLRITARAVDPVTGEARTLERLWRTDDTLGGLSAARITDRVRWQLEGWLTASSLGQGVEPAPIAGLALAAEEVAPAGALQPRLWGPGAGEDLRARRAVERVQALAGGDAVLTVRLQGGRDPRDRVQLVPYGEQVPPERDPDRPWPGALPPPAPSVVLPEPVPARVLDDAGYPVVVDVRLGVSGDPARVVVPREGAWNGIDAAVVDWAGPWPVAERWWTPQGRRRVFLQVVADGEEAPTLGLLLSSSAGDWSLEALYD
jgi:protein ImuB